MNKTNKTYLLTGAAGFLGSNLLERLLRDGHRVIAVDNLLTGNLSNIRHLIPNERCHFVNVDVSEHLVEKYVYRTVPDCIIHLASPASPKWYLKYPIETLKVGSFAPYYLLEYARETKASFMIASTSEVYGDPLISPQPESYWGHVNPIGPRSVYDEAKRFQEALTIAYHQKYGIDTKIIRIFNTYGPRMDLNDGRAVPQFIKSCLSGKDISIFGDGSITRSFQYVDDLVEGICQFLQTEYHQPINLGNPDEITIKQLAEEIIELTESDSKIVYREEMVDDPKQRKPVIDRARKVLGWEPVINRKDGLLKTINYFKNSFSI